MIAKTPVKERPIEVPAVELPEKLHEDRAPTYARPAAPRPGVTLIAVLALLLVCGVGVLFLAGWLPRQRRVAALAAGAEAAASAPQRVGVVKPRRGEATSPVVLPGTIEALQETDIHARISGYLKKWYADIGDDVAEGQLLAEIETPELDQEIGQATATLTQLQAKLVSAKAAEALADSTLERYQGLVGQGAVTKQEVAEKTATRDSAHASVEVSKADIAAGEANLRRLRETKAFARVVAPFAGTVTKRNVDVGALVSVGPNASQDLFHLADSSTVRVFVDVPQSLSAGVEAGAPAEIQVREARGRSFAGKITRTARAIDPRARTLRTEVTIPNPDRALLPGTFVRVRFSVKRAEAPILIPAGALSVTADGTRVAVVGQDDRVRYQRVEIAADLGTELAIASGLDGSERVVTNPGERLREGDQVSVAP
jgi:RND family efflux transporter MFP subunit